MPRYYFHCAGDDTEGLELPDDETACAEARAGFDEMIEQGTVPPGSCMEVVDERGRQVARFSSRFGYCQRSA